jgi:hypothetical protein
MTGLSFRTFRIISENLIYNNQCMGLTMIHAGCRPAELFASALSLVFANNDGGVSGKSTSADMV